MTVRGETIVSRKIRWTLAAGGIVLAVLGILIWQEFRPHPDVETMGEDNATLAWVGLGTSLVGLTTSLVTLITTIRKSTKQ